MKGSSKLVVELDGTDALLLSGVLSQVRTTFLDRDNPEMALMCDRIRQAIDSGQEIEENVYDAVIEGI